MSQDDTPPAKEGSRPAWSELSSRALYDKCMALARNLWWSWHPEVINLFRDLDPVRWRRLDHNPIALLGEMTPELLERRAAELVLYTRINQAYRRLQEYMASQADVGGRAFGSPRVQAGGLSYDGIRHPRVGPHLFWRSRRALGRPYQECQWSGRPARGRRALLRPGLLQTGTRHQRLPAGAICRHESRIAADGAGVGQGWPPITVSIDTRDGPLLAKVWLMHVGRVPLYLLDCDVEGNSPQDRELTSRLYGGDQRTRIRQELVLGVGAVKALGALGITPGVYHLNEGHSGFATLEVIRERMQHDGMNFDDALREVAQRTVFTTHTPVPAGHDRFDGGLVEEHLGPLRDALGISHEQLMGLGRVEPQNGVGDVLHDRVGAEAVTPRKCRQLPSRTCHPHGCGPTCGRGVSKKRSRSATSPTACTFRVGSPIRCSCSTIARFGTDWQIRMGDPDVWEPIYTVDPGELWEIHNALKNLLLEFVRRRCSRQCRRRSESEDVIEAAHKVLDPGALTIGFARRFATYKRADLMLSDPDRLAAIVNNSQRPVQFIFAGKAHPADEPGKQLIKRIENLRHDPRFAGRDRFC